MPYHDERVSLCPTYLRRGGKWGAHVFRFISLSLLMVTSLNAQYAPRVGQLHADITLPKIDDRQPVSLSDYRGKKVLLIHFASW